MVRELSEGDASALAPSESSGRLSVPELCDIADTMGVGAKFRAVIAAAEKHGLHARGYKRCVMLTPPQNQARCLFAIWTDHPQYGPMTTYLYTSAFPRFYEVDEETAVSLLGEDRYLDGKADGAVEELIENLDRFFAKVNKES